MMSARPGASIFLVLATFLLGPATSSSPALAETVDARQERGCIVRAEVDGAINAAVADYLSDATSQAKADQCTAVLVTVDTPGGDLQATRRIVQIFIESEVPVIAYVSPGGARAGSAGMFVVLAAHVAAMAPATNIGAAHPVILGGKDPEEGGGKAMGRKVENDAAAFARAVAERHGRNAVWAESSVRSSQSASAQEALALGIIDLVVSSEKQLLVAVDGRSLESSRGPTTLATAHAEIRQHRMTMSQRVRAALGHPTLAYTLLLLGILGLVMEVYSPGLIVPGVIGAVALLLAAIGLNAMPFRIGAIALLLVASVLFIAEFYVTSFGILAISGFFALALGAALLVDRSDPDFYADPSFRVSWAVIAPLAAIVAGAVAAVGWVAVRTRNLRSPTGAEGLLGQHGRALTTIDGAGRVLLGGERWNAVSALHIEQGSPIEVVGVDGLCLTVEAVDER